jgi:hypothetical protein
MLKVYDVYCTCGYENEVFCEEGDFGNCPNCGKELMRAFNSFNFELKYNPKKDRVAWGNSNYEESQYWRAVKEEKFATGVTPSHPGSCDHPVTKKEK